MVKNVKIRILAFFMAVTLSFCVVSSDYQEVKALEWAGTVVAFDTAIKAILGLLGVGVAVGTASQIDWGQLKDDCVEYQIAQGNNSALVGKWWNDVINGALDTGSSCWASFKSWVSNELLSSSGGDVSAEPMDLLKTVFPNLQSYTPTSFDDYNIKYAYYSVNLSQPTIVNVAFFDDKFNVDVLTSGNNQYITFLSSSRDIYFHAENYNVNSTSLSLQRTAIYSSPLSNNGYQFYLYGVDNSLIGLHDYYHVWDGISSLPHLGDFDSAVSDLGTIGLAPDVATDLPYDGVIEIPWENVGATDTAIDDAFDDALDKVNTGTWTLDQYWTWVQNVTNVFAYDTTNNFLLPNDGDDEKADDKVQQNINRGAMVLYGLEKVFPFCIPWDIYAFVNLLVADPVAPVIEYPIYNPVSSEDEIITIDFSVWESQVILMRYIQDFLLIIGLLLLARSLIGAGGSD